MPPCFVQNKGAWDSDINFACVCDSSWKVGLGAGERQEPEWHGADCSKQHCPSGNDPATTANELNCYNVSATGGRGHGALGNLCQVDCSNRGSCNLEDGACTCFAG